MENTITLTDNRTGKSAHYDIKNSTLGNGVFDISNTHTNPFVVSTVTNLQIGGSSILGGYLNGNISQTSIYNRALSATEVLQNYNATKTRFGL